MVQFKNMISCVDAHTAGEPARVVVSGLPSVHGRTMLERRAHFRDNLDSFRKFLIREPRGHADMYVCLLQPPTTDDGDYGLLFLHSEGYATMCGHASIAAARVVLDTGMKASHDGLNELLFDTPAGRVKVSAEIKKGTVEKISFDNVPTFVHLPDIRIPLDGIGEISGDIVFCGGFFAFFDVAQLGMNISPENSALLYQKGREAHHKILEKYAIVHPQESDINGLYGVILTSAPTVLDNRVIAKNVCVSDAGIDRSPCGTGTSGRATLLYDRGIMKKGMILEHHSIIDTVFECAIKEEAMIADKKGVVTTVSGNAHITGFNQLVLTPDDPLPEGFYLK